jgi:hypothetical protein
MKRLISLLVITVMLLGVLAVLITFFVVNLLPNIVSVHSYAR